MINIPGKRKNSTLFVHNDFSYSVDKRCKNLYRCCLRRVSGCRGSLICEKDKETTTYTLKTNHNHDPDPSTLTVHFLKREMLEMCRDVSPMSPQAIYAAVCRRHENIPAKLTFESVKTLLTREIEHSRPTVPETVEALNDFLVDYEPLKAIYKGIAITDDGKKVLLFSDEVLLKALAKASQLFNSSQYLIIPTIPPMRYVMTVHVQEQNLDIATALIMLEDLSEAVQRCAWKKLIALAPGMQDHVTSIVCDYEQAKISVIRDCFPDAKMYGSWASYKQAIWNEWFSLGLPTASRDLMSMAMSLPLAPQSFFEESFKVMQEVADVMSREQPSVLQFMAYMRTVWLPIAQKLSVYRSPARVSNIVESFQRTIAVNLKVDSDLMKIFGQWKKLIVAQAANYRHLQEDGFVRNVRTRVNRERAAKILKLQNDVVKKRLTIGEFLKAFNMFYVGYGTTAKPVSPDINGNDIATYSEWLASDVPDDLEEDSATEDVILRRVHRRRQIEVSQEADVVNHNPATSDDEHEIAEAELNGNNRPNTRSHSASQANTEQLNESDEHIYDPPLDDYGYWRVHPDEPESVPFLRISTADMLSPCSGTRRPGICCVCISESANQLLQPCNHMCCCEQCANDIEVPKCPLCNQLVLSRITVITT